MLGPPSGNFLTPNVNTLLAQILFRFISCSKIYYACKCPALLRPLWKGPSQHHSLWVSSQKVPSKKQENIKLWMPCHRTPRQYPKRPFPANLGRNSTLALHGARPIITDWFALIATPLIATPHITIKILHIIVNCAQRAKTARTLAVPALAIRTPRNRSLYASRNEHRQQWTQICTNRAENVDPNR